MKLKKITCPFTRLQAAALFFLAVISICFFIQPVPYSKTLDENLNPARFDFLQMGDYTLDIAYEHADAGTILLIYSEEMTDEFNNRGIVYLEQALGEGSGIVQLPLSLEYPSYGVCVRAESNGDSACSLTQVRIQSNRLIYKDNYILCGLTLLLGILLAFLFGKMNRTAAGTGLQQELVPGYPDRYTLPVILTALGLLASLPLFSDSVFISPDAEFHLSRIESIYRSMKAGDFPVRITAQQLEGYGNLTASMYPQLFLYPAALLRFFGASLMLSYKITLTAVNIAAAFASFYGAKNICGSRKAGLWMSLFYTFSIYRLTNIYVRGALGETLAMVFLPLVMWGVYEILWGKRRWIVLVPGMTGVLNSHVLTTQMCALFMAAALIYWLLSKKKEQFGKRFLDGCKAVAVTVLLNAFFLVPFLYFCGQDLQCFHLEFEIYEHAAYFSQMFALFPSVESPSLPLGTTQFEMPLTIGGALFAGVALFWLASGKSENTKKRDSAGFYCFVMGATAVILASWIFPWKKAGEVPLLSSIFSSLQFPWRFLGPASAFWSLTAAVGVTDFAEKKTAQILPAANDSTAAAGHSGHRRWVYAITAALILVSTAYLFDSLAQKRYQSPDKMALEGLSEGDSMYLYFEGGEYRAIHNDYYRSDMYIRTAEPTAIEFSDFRKEAGRIHVEVTPGKKEENILMFPLYWYPGYEITVNGENVPVFSNDALVSCDAPDVKSIIEVRYRGFWFFRLGDIITALTLGGIMGVSFYQLRKKWKSAGNTHAEPC